MNPRSGGLEKLLKKIDSFTSTIGKGVGWLVIAISAVLLYEVISRAFCHGTVWAVSLSYQLYAAIFMLGAAYTLRLGAHIRISYFWENFSPKKKAAVEVVFYLLVFFPTVAVFIIYGTDWAWQSWKWFEVEPPDVSLWGEPIYPFKTLLPLGFYLLALQGIAEFLKSLGTLYKRENRR